MEEIKAEAKQNYIPIVRDETAKKLEDICVQYQPKKILEIGTAIGYSGIKMLKNCNAVLYTIEKDEKRATVAKDNFNKYNVSERVIQFVDDAQKTIENLLEQNEKFDLIFLDGPKGQYIKYYPILKKLLISGGILFCDNIYLQGMVKQEGKVPHKHRSMVNNLRKFIEALKMDKDLDTKFYDIDDGFSISMKTV